MENSYFDRNTEEELEKWYQKTHVRKDKLERINGNSL
jgi:hypothetical protein